MLLLCEILIIFSTQMVDHLMHFGLHFYFFFIDWLFDVEAIFFLPAAFIPNTFYTIRLFLPVLFCNLFLDAAAFPMPCSYFVFGLRVCVCAFFFCKMHMICLVLLLLNLPFWFRSNSQCVCVFFLAANRSETRTKRLKKKANNPDASTCEANKQNRSVGFLTIGMNIKKMCILLNRQQNIGAGTLCNYALWLCV